MHSKILAVGLIAAATAISAIPLDGASSELTILEREFPEVDFDLVERDSNWDDIEGRDYDDELEARDFDELEERYYDDILDINARDFDDDVFERDFDDDIFEREFDDAFELEARNPLSKLKNVLKKDKNKSSNDHKNKDDTPDVSMPKINYIGQVGAQRKAAAVKAVKNLYKDKSYHKFKEIDLDFNGKGSNVMYRVHNGNRFQGGGGVMKID